MVHSVVRSSFRTQETSNIQGSTAIEGESIVFIQSFTKTLWTYSSKDTLSVKDHYSSRVAPLEAKYAWIVSSATMEMFCTWPDITIMLPNWFTPCRHRLVAATLSIHACNFNRWVLISVGVLTRVVPFFARKDWFFIAATVDFQRAPYFLSIHRGINTRWDCSSCHISAEYTIWIQIAALNKMYTVWRYSNIFFWIIIFYFTQHCNTKYSNITLLILSS